MQNLNWNELKALDFAYPAYVDAAELLRETFQLLASSDPTLRDELAYPALAAWLERGHLDEYLEEVSQQACECLKANAIHLRSFAALALAEVIARDAKIQRLEPESLSQLQTCWSDWYIHESDLRSWDSHQGWLHALAHGADVATQLGLHPLLVREALQLVLNTLLRRIQTVSELPMQFEDDRIALALFFVLNRVEIKKDWQSFNEKLAQLWQPPFGQPRSPGSAFATQVGRSLLMLTLYGAEPFAGVTLPAQPELAQLLGTALKRAFPVYPGMSWEAP